MSADRQDRTTTDSRSAPPSQRSRARSPVHMGELIANKYRVDGLLGAGGVGVVVEATHLGLDERVAIKLLQPDALKDADTVARFQREARAAVRIKGEHVARIIDVGETDSGVPFMVMEHLTGRDLGGVLRDRTSLPISEAVDYVLQACVAVAEAHALGIVHRDLKPANLFLSRRGDGTPQVKVLDFGISKFVPRDGSIPDISMTQTTTVIGSPLYMSPEQMESAKIADARSDIWSLGTILFELIAGGAAFEAPTMPQLCARILNGEPTKLRSLAPDCPEELELAVERCLRKDPNDRFAHIGAFAAAILPFASSVGVSAASQAMQIADAAGLAPDGEAAAAITSDAMARARNRVGSTTRPFAETRKDVRLPSKRVGFGIAAIGIALGIGFAYWGPGSAGSAGQAMRARSLVLMYTDQASRKALTQIAGESPIGLDPTDGKVKTPPNGEGGSSTTETSAEPTATPIPPPPPRYVPPPSQPVEPERNVLEER